MSQQKPPLIVQISSSLSTTVFDYSFFNINCQPQLGAILWRHQHANAAFIINMLGHTVLVDTYMKDIHEQSMH